MGGWASGSVDMLRDRFIETNIYAYLPTYLPTVLSLEARDEAIDGVRVRLSIATQAAGQSHAL